MSVVTGSAGVMMPNGMVMDDSGELHESVQSAQDAASSFIWIGPGTFNEAVTVDTAGLMVLGSGRGTLIDAGDSGSEAISIEAANVLVTNLSARTSPGQAGAVDTIVTGGGGDNCMIHNVWVRNSDATAIWIQHGSDHILSSCIAESTEVAGHQTDRDRTIIMNCISETDVGGNGVRTTGAVPATDCVIAGCIVNGVGGFGIQHQSNGGVVTGNRIHDSGDDGIFNNSNNSIISNNRISGSTNEDIDDDGTGTTLDDNRTGSAN